jgi:hypothetical protein
LVHRKVRAHGMLAKLWNHLQQLGQVSRCELMIARFNYLRYGLKQR